MEKKCKKAKWLSGEGLQIAVKRREKKKKAKKNIKQKEEKQKAKRSEKERYKHLNAEFQRIARRDNKAFLSNHCKEIEENNRMGKTRDLFKKITDTKGTFLIHGDGLDPCLLYNVTNLSPQFIRHSIRSSPLNLFLTSTV